MIGGFDHVHVTEREVAHQSPCGWDDAKWEDCTFMSAVEWWRATGHPDVPATHEEGEHLRCASGRSMLGGTNLFDVVKAIRARYKASTPAPIRGFSTLWGALKPGTVAVSQGSMGAFPSTSKWRRWDRSFGGAHAVCIFRVDASDRVWWCDPLAPKGTYSGEWMSKADLKKYVDAFGGYHLVGKIVPSKEEDMYHSKPGGPIIGTAAMLAGRYLLNTTDPKGKRYGPRTTGEAYTVYAAMDLVDPKGVPIDIDGNQPPKNNRDQVYLVDRPEFGASAFALRHDVTFEPIVVTVPDPDCVPKQAVDDMITDAVEADRAKAKVGVVYG